VAIAPHDALLTDVDKPRDLAKSVTVEGQIGRRLSPPPGRRPCPL